MIALRVVSAGADDQALYRPAFPECSEKRRQSRGLGLVAASQLFIPDVREADRRERPGRTEPVATVGFPDPS
jgi:hypothetical protein